MNTPTWLWILITLIVFGAGVGAGMYLWERKVRRQLRAVLMGFQVGLVRTCPMCKQHVAHPSDGDETTARAYLYMN